MQTGRLVSVITAVVNLKGGSGKTSTVIHLAAALRETGESVLIVDGDPQGSALDWANTLGWDATGLPRNTIHKQPWLSTSHQNVLIDTPPGDLGITTSAARAADLILIPIQPTSGDFSQYAETVNLIEQVQALTDAPAFTLLTRVVKRTVAAGQIRDALKPFGVPVLTSEIPQAQALAMAYGLPITDPGQYRNVLAELKGIVK